MTYVSKIVEIVGRSTKGWEDAAQVNDEVKEIMKKYRYNTHDKF
jgi:flavin-binding protein dodecin